MMRHFHHGLLLCLFSFLVGAFNPGDARSINPSVADTRFQAHERTSMLIARGISPSSLDEVGPPVSAPGSHASSSRNRGASSRASPGSTPRTGIPPDGSTRSTDRRTAQQMASISRAQAREQVKAKARTPIEPLPPNVVAAVARMPKPAGDPMSDMPHAPTAVAAAARRLALLRRPMAGSPLQIPQAAQRQQNLPLNVPDSPGGTSQSSPRTPTLSIANSDTPDRSQPGTPVRATDSHRSSFAFGEQRPRSTARQASHSGSRLESMGSTPRMPPGPGTASASSFAPGPSRPDPTHREPSSSRQGTLPSRPTISQSRAQNRNALLNPNAAPAGLIQQPAPQAAPQAAQQPAHQPAPPPAQIMPQVAAQPLGPQNAALHRNPVISRSFLGAATGATVAATGMGLLATGFPGHIIAGGLVGGAGLAGMLGSQTAPHMANLAEQARAQREAGLNPMREAIRPLETSARNAMNGLAAHGRAVGERIRSLSRAPADQNVMDHLRRRSEDYILI